MPSRPASRLAPGSSYTADDPTLRFRRGGSDLFHDEDSQPTLCGGRPYETLVVRERLFSMDVHDELLTGERVFSAKAYDDATRERVFSAEAYDDALLTRELPRMDRALLRGALPSSPDAELSTDIEVCIEERETIPLAVAAVAPEALYERREPEQTHVPERRSVRTIEGKTRALRALGWTARVVGTCALLAVFWLVVTSEAAKRVMPPRMSETTSAAERGARSAVDKGLSGVRDVFQKIKVRT